MRSLTLYTTAQCPYCDAAKRLLKSKGASWKEVRVDLDPMAKDAMISRSGRRTVPQIFIETRHVGGFDDLSAADRRGELDEWLGED